MKIFHGSPIWIISLITKVSEVLYRPAICHDHVVFVKLFSYI